MTYNIFITVLEGGGYHIGLKLGYRQIPYFAT